MFYLDFHSSSNIHKRHNRKKEIMGFMESSNRRSKLEICFEVLEVINQGVCKPTRIMYASNLSYAALTDVLSTLKSSAFIHEQRTKRSKYYITPKGQDALRYYNKSLEGLQELEIMA